MTNKLKLENNTILITGGGSGIGLELAKTLSRLSDSISRQNLNSLNCVEATP